MKITIIQGIIGRLLSSPHALSMASLSLPNWWWITLDCAFSSELGQQRSDRLLGGEQAQDFLLPETEDEILTVSLTLPSKVQEMQFTVSDVDKFAVFAFINTAVLLQLKLNCHSVLPRPTVSGKYIAS